MEIKILERGNHNLSLLVKSVDVPYINALRRMIISEVPCMAIDDVVILENSSVLQDEVISHRLGLVPLRTDLESYNLPEECECKSEFGCSLCGMTLTLDVESKEGTRTVYSSELVSESKEAMPASNMIPLAKLAKEQKLRLEAYARLGKGKTHAKWQPVSMCTHKYYPKIEISSKICDMCAKCVDICPKRVLAKSDKKIIVQNLLACTLCRDCVEICKKEKSAIEVGWEENTFIFSLESTGALPAQTIVMEAVKILDKQLKEINSQIRVT